MATKMIIYNGDDSNTLDTVVPAVEISNKPVITFGFNDGNMYRAVNVELKNEFASFDLIRYGENLGRVTLGIPGKHHVYNALAVIASAMFRSSSIAAINSALYFS